MKIDLITILPGFTLENNENEDFQKRNVDELKVINELKFGTAHIFTKKIMLDQIKQFNKNHIKPILDIDKRIKDESGNVLGDYVIIIDKNIEDNYPYIPNPDSQTLLKFLAFIDSIDNRVPIDTIKLMCVSEYSFPLNIYINNLMVRTNKNQIYLLPTSKELQSKLIITDDFGVVFFDVLEKIKKNKIERYKQLITSISLFNESCGMAYKNPNSAIVLIVSALEALFDLPRRNKKSSLGLTMKILWGFDEQVKKWVEELYEIRSQIVHGKSLEGEKLLASTDKHYPHYDIAREIFADCLLLILEGTEYIKLPSETRENIIGKLKGLVVSNKKKIEKIINANYTFQKFLEKKSLYKKFIKSVEAITPYDETGHIYDIQLLKTIFTISIDWINHNIEIYKNPTEDVRTQVSQGYLQLVDKLLVELKEFMNMDRETDGMIKITRKRDKIRRSTNRLERIMHQKSIYEFTVTEFLDRCLSFSLVL